MEYLTCKGIEILRYDSAMQQDAKEEALKERVQVKTRLKALFTSPESLQRRTPLMSVLTQAHAANLLSFVVVDEAHCVASWSSFRYCLRQRSHCSNV
jgi:superfamily II DNA helicase RecQ